MKTETYEIECLYKAIRDGVLIRQEQWRTWMSADYTLGEATIILNAGLEMAKERDCMFKDCRLIKVTREIV